MGELRPFQLSDLTVPEDLEHDSGRYLLLLLPDGGIELTQVPGRPELVLWLYSNATNLVASCGDGQPWTYARAGVIGELVRAADGPVLLAMDLWHPDGARYPEPDVTELEPLGYLDEPSMPPDEVWIPSRPVRTGDRQVDVELHSVQGNPTPCLLVYDSLARLRAGCGRYQSAAAIPVDQIDEAAREAGAQRVLFNPVLHERARHTGVVRDWASQNHF